VPDVQKVERLNLKPALSETTLQTVRHRFNIMQVAVLPWHCDVKMGIANSLHAST